jgi:hypothetical protein
MTLGLRAVTVDENEVEHVFQQYLNALTCSEKTASSRHCLKQDTVVQHIEDRLQESVQLMCLRRPGFVFVRLVDSPAEPEAEGLLGQKYQPWITATWVCLSYA